MDDFRVFLRVLTVVEEPFVIGIFAVIDADGFFLRWADDSQNLGVLDGGQGTRRDDEHLLRRKGLSLALTLAPGWGRRKDGLDSPSTLFCLASAPCVEENEIPLSVGGHRVTPEAAEAFLSDEVFRFCRKPAGMLELIKADSLDVLLSPKNELLLFFPLNLGLPDRNGDHQTDAHDREKEEEHEKDIAVSAT